MAPKAVEGMEVIHSLILYLIYMLEPMLFSSPLMDVLESSNLAQWQLI